MQVHPEIAALRSDRFAQRCIQARMQAALSGWKRSEQVAQLAEDLAQYGAGAEISRCPSLAPIVSAHGDALALVNGWQAAMLGALNCEPLGEIPHIYRYSPGLSRMQLLASGRAALSVMAYERREAPAPAIPATALFVDGESYEVVLAGSASGTLHELDAGAAHPATVTSEPVHWTAGDRIILRNGECARQVTQVEGCMVVLQLTRTPPKPRPTREFRLSDGALLRRASGDKAASQRLMALAVLGAMEHAPARQAMSARALDRSEDSDVRWEAVRQALALDTAEGMGLLADIEARTGDPLQCAAADLHEQLLAAFAREPA